MKMTKTVLFIASLAVVITAGGLTAMAEQAPVTARTPIKAQTKAQTKAQKKAYMTMPWQKSLPIRMSAPAQISSQTPVRMPAPVQKPSAQVPAQASGAGKTASGQVAKAGINRKPGIKLQWKAPAGFAASKIVGYDILRASKQLGPYKKINKNPIKTLSYEDRGLKDKQGYFYEVCTVMQNGSRSRPTKPVGIIAGNNQPYAPPAINSFTTDAAGQIKYAGDVVFFNMSGTPGDKAVFSIEGQTGSITRPSRKIRMKEIAPGVYRGACSIGRGVRIVNGYAVATLSDKSGGQAAAKTDANLDFIGIRKPAISGLRASGLKSDHVCISWFLLNSGQGYYNLYRDTSRIVDVTKLTPLSANINPGVSTYIDDSVKSGASYYYVLAYNDASGAAVAISKNLKVNVPRLQIIFGKKSVEEDSGGKVLKPGDVLNVTFNTLSGGDATFSMRNAAHNLKLTEGPSGVYKGALTVKEGEGIFKARVAVNFTAPDGSRHSAMSATLVSVDAPKVKPKKAAAVVAAVKPAIGKKPIAGKKTVKVRKPVIAGIEDNISAVVGSSGRLTAGEKFTVTIKGDPGNRAWFTIGNIPRRIFMKQTAPGIYEGSYTIRPMDNAGTSADRLEPAYITGFLRSPRGAVSDPIKSSDSVVVDTSCKISVQPSVYSLPADGKSRATIDITVTDADGQPVEGRRLALMLKSVHAQKAGNLGRLKAYLKNLTDSQGKMTAIYISGTAAKTAMVLVRDNSTGSSGNALITTEGPVSSPSRPSPGPGKFKSRQLPFPGSRRIDSSLKGAGTVGLR